MHWSSIKYWLIEFRQVDWRVSMSFDSTAFGEQQNGIWSPGGANSQVASEGKDAKDGAEIGCEAPMSPSWREVKRGKAARAETNFPILFF